jgi:GAF domain-containing protein
MSDSDAGNAGLKIVWKAPAAAGKEWHGNVRPLLDLCLAQTRSDGAYMYQLHQDAAELELVLWQGPQPNRASYFRVRASAATADWYRNLEAAFAPEGTAAEDWRYQDLPEFLQHRFASAVSVPLREGDEVIGVANFCRAEEEAYSEEEAAFLESFGRLFGSLLAQAELRAQRDRLEYDLGRLSRKLADRGVVERAKGILQVRLSCTEEEAYLLMRRASRQRRTAMGEIARSVIDQGDLLAPVEEPRLRAVAVVANAVRAAG